MKQRKIKILVIGALGQIGTELTSYLRSHYGDANVIAADIRKNLKASESGPFAVLDCTDGMALFELVKRHDITVIYHLAALLSVAAEHKPKAAWELNITGLQNVLEVARINQCQVYVPSSIAAFGPSTPSEHTPQVTIQRPNTIYGISKVTAELLCDYYSKRYKMDIRGLRYPGLISHKAPPGGGTTDYAIELLQAASKGLAYKSPISKDTRLDMMYMPDALKATVELMQADINILNHRNAYNITAFSFNPVSLVEVVRQFVPSFTLTTEIDKNLQAIADSWPNSLDDSAARQDWGWQPEYTIEMMVEEILKVFSQQNNAPVAGDASRTDSYVGGGL